MPQSRPPYPPEFRPPIIEWAQAGRTADELAKAFEPSAQTIRRGIKPSAMKAIARTG